jgi:hypothetical protein
MREKQRFLAGLMEVLLCCVCSSRVYVDTAKTKDGESLGYRN